MRWQTKAALQRLLERVPGGPLVYGVGQQCFGGLRHYRIDGKVEQGTRLLRALAAAGQTIDGRCAVEVGTGWAPVVPMLFWLHGLDSCDSYDVTPLLKERLVVETARQLVDHYSPHGNTAAGGGIRIDQARLDGLAMAVRREASASQILELCGIRCHAPGDASRTAHESHSVDLFFSNTVLEHVPADRIRPIFEEAHRILRPDGIMIHLIDPSDHFSHADESISSINFLQYSEREFSRYNSSFCFQNRLRVSAYLQLVAETDFTILHAERRVDESAIAVLPRLNLHSDFSGFPPQEICSTSVAVVARPI
jgi:SAM-dependent methyltransferase